MNARKHLNRVNRYTSHIWRRLKCSIQVVRFQSFAKTQSIAKITDTTKRSSRGTVLLNFPHPSSSKLSSKAGREFIGSTCMRIRRAQRQILRHRCFAVQSRWLSAGVRLFSGCITFQKSTTKQTKKYLRYETDRFKQHYGLTIRWRFPTFSESRAGKINFQ